MCQGNDMTTVLNTKGKSPGDTWLWFEPIEVLKCFKLKMNPEKSWDGRDLLKVAASNIFLNVLLTSCGLLGTKATEKALLIRR